jgi:antitoxin component of MazEF toxin-antitoxin module
MKTKVRKIGNSFGIIIGKKLLEQAEVKEEVSLSIEDSKIIIEAVKVIPVQVGRKCY